MLATAGLAAGCTPTIGVPVADDAANPVCADVVLALPDVVDGLHQTKTDSQATTAWGEPGAAVTLRCGVAPPGPTASEPCTTVPGADADVDWLASPDAEGTWTFVTYGRDPAVEVKVPPTVRKDHSTAFIGDLNGPVSKIPQKHRCVGLDDVPTPAS
ncbi:uncharacterized protein DUF3515 [Cellulomonas sp. PhB143]|nr:uncharacterized protein DUF3515 [Cellulomonas sp. PhB143]